jgi:hypothetical protein
VVDDFKGLRRDGLVDKTGKPVRQWPAKREPTGRVRPQRVFGWYDSPAKVEGLADFITGHGCAVVLREVGATIDQEEIVEGLGIVREVTA